MNFIKCRICNKELKQITNTHLKKHNMTIEEYKEMFPNEKMLCENILSKKDTSKFINYDKTSKSLKKVMKEVMNNTIDEKLGKIKDFEVICFRCSKTFTIQEREKQFPKKEKYYCSRSCANSRSINHSQSTRKKISDAVKENWKNEQERKFQML